MKKQNNLDIAAAIKHFFELPDWKQRSLYFGGAYLIAVVVYIIAIFLFMIPLVGCFIGFGLILLVFIYFILFTLFIQGYMYDLVKVIAKDEDPQSVLLLDKYKERIKHGFKITLANLVYFLPIIILNIVAYGLIFLILPLLESSNFDVSVVAGLWMGLSMIGMYVIMGVSFIYQMLQVFFVYPASLYIYFSEGTLKAMLDIPRVWKFIKDNVFNLLIVSAIIFGAGMMFYFASFIAGVLIFLCIGIILVPIVYGIGGTWILHTYSHLLGQLFRIHEKK